MLTETKLAALATLLDDAVNARLEGLSQSAAAALLSLHHRAPITTSELARIMGVTQPTAVRVIDGLVRNGLVARGARAGRSAPLNLTRRGSAKAKTVQAARLQVAGDLLAALSTRERATLATLIDKLLAGATEGRRQARRVCRLCAHDVCHGAACPVGTRATEIEQAA